MAAVPVLSTPATPSGFQKVLSNFRSRLTKSELEEFNFCTLDDVKQTIVNIQAFQEQQREEMHFSRVLGFLEAMDQFGKVVEVFLNSSEILCFVWGPLKFLLQVASSWAESFDTLLDAYQQIGEQIPLLLQYQTVFETSPHMASVLEMIYKDILEFHQQALRVFGKSTWQQIFRAVWKDFDTRFKHLLTDLQRHKCLIESQANVLEIQASQAAREMAEKAFREAEVARRDHQRITVRTWLSARNVKLDHEAYVEMRRDYPDTGLWILKKPAIAAWCGNQSSSDSLVWMNGIPGAGKTILASVIVENSRSQPSVIVTYFYCKYKDRERNTFVAVVRAILAQMLVQSKDSDLLQVLYETSIDSGEQSLESQVLCGTLLTIALGSVSNNTCLHIVIDGVDECDSAERKKIISGITAILRNESSGRIRAIFISQPEIDIRSLLRNATVIRLRETDNESDISEYARRWCLKIQNKFVLAEAKRDSIHSLVCEAAGGMFLFVKLILRNLYFQTSRAQLYEALQPNKFPRGLNEAYGRIVDRIENNENIAERDQALNLLGWVVTAKRPLIWSEIQGAVSIDIERQTVDFEERSLALDIGELCGSLIEKLPGDRIELVHTSAKIYLRQDEHVSIARTEGQFAYLCLQYLTFPGFDSDVDEDENSLLVKLGFFAFQNYATLHWVDHLQTYLEILQPDDIEDLENLAPVCEEFLAAYGPGQKYKYDANFMSDLRDGCRAAEHQASFETFVALIAHARYSRAGNDSFEGLGDLGKTMHLSRKNLERIAQDKYSSSAKTLTDFYGSLLFRCPKHLCYYFHEGFSDPRIRDDHVQRHERPFCCKADGCSRVQTGFCTDADLQRHIKKNHSHLKAAATLFPKREPKAKPNQQALHIKQERKVRQFIFPCNVCPKKFTRAATLNEHLRTHTGERPFTCSVCGKSFIRVKEWGRHKETHSGQKEFICSGYLSNMCEWGCGREFARADALARHFKSALGQRCLRPLLQESEAQSRQRAQTQSTPRQEPQHLPQGPLQEPVLTTDMNLSVGGIEDNSSYNIPSTLFARFPEFENLDWSDMTDINLPELGGFISSTDGGQG